MSEFFLQSVHIFFWVFKFYFYFLGGSIDELIEVDCNNLQDLFFIHFVRRFDFVFIISEISVQFYLIVVAFSLLVGEVIYVDAHC